MNIIETYNLKKSFKNITAVNDLNLTVNKGEMFGLVGPDGAGKTTTIRMLCGIMKPDGGKGLVLGNDIFTQSELIKGKIGYLSQIFSLYQDLSIDENIDFIADIHNVKNYSKLKDELLEFTRLTPFRDRLAGRLSGGMKQKLALACTLIHTPEILFLDEPTTGVDPISRRDFWNILSELLKQNVTIFMSTPYMDEAERCSRVGLMNIGKIMVCDTPENIKNSLNIKIFEIVCPDCRKTLSYAKSSGFISDAQLFGDKVHIIPTDNNIDIIQFKNNFNNQGIKIENIREISPSLEDIFISLIKENNIDKNDGKVT